MVCALEILILRAQRLCEEYMPEGGKAAVNYRTPMIDHGAGVGIEAERSWSGVIKNVHALLTRDFLIWLLDRRCQAFQEA